MAADPRPPSEAPIPVIFSVDVEPDDHVYDPERPSPWTSFELMARRLRELRRRLTEVTGTPARFCWALRIDPQIEKAYGTPTWVVDEFGPLLEEFLDQGDAIGIHPHPWRWDGARRLWISDHVDEAWIHHCVEMSFGAYCDAFGRAPAFHRFGAMFMSTPIMNLVRTLGIPVDLTVEPGEPPIAAGDYLGGISNGPTPDFADAPRVPYQADPSDFLTPDRESADGLWAIPLSSGPLATRTPADRILRVRKNWDRVLHPTRSARGVARRFRPPPDADPKPQVTLPAGNHTLRLWFDYGGPVGFWNTAFDVAKGIERPYLAFAIRSDLLIRRRDRRIFEANVRSLLKDPRARNLVFTTPDDTLRRLGLLHGTEPPPNDAGWSADVVSQTAHGGQ